MTADLDRSSKMKGRELNSDYGLQTYSLVMVKNKKMSSLKSEFVLFITPSFPRHVDITLI